MLCKVLCLQTCVHYEGDFRILVNPVDMHQTTITNAGAVFQIRKQNLVGFRVIVQLRDNVVEIALLVIFCYGMRLTQMVNLLIAPLHDEEPVLIAKRDNGEIAKMSFLLS